MDDSAKTSRLVVDTVDLADVGNIAQWTEIWDISEAELIEAVQICGPIAADIKRYLRSRKT